MQKKLPDLDKYQSIVAGSIPPHQVPLALLSHLPKEKHLQLRAKSFGLNLSLFSLTLDNYIKQVESGDHDCSS